MITLRQLTHARTLAKLGNFRMAAQVLHLSQPALTRSIQALEAELGVKLFNRLVHSVEPTRFGEAFLPKAHLLLQVHDDLTREMKVLQALERSLAGDHAKTHVSAVSSLGLVEMTRKRTRESLEHLLCSACPTCEGRGFVKSPETVAYEVFREVLRQSRQFEFQQFVVLAHQDVIELLLDEESAALGELELATGKPIRLQAETLYAQDQYDVVLI